MGNGVFDPADIRKLVSAYTDALAAAGKSYDNIPAPLLSRIVARQIIAEACRGERDIADLADSALRALRRPIPLGA